MRVFLIVNMGYGFVLHIFASIYARTCVLEAYYNLLVHVVCFRSSQGFLMGCVYSYSCLYCLCAPIMDEHVRPDPLLHITA